MGKTYALAPRTVFTPLETGEYVLTLLEVSEKAEERDTAFSKKGDIRLEFRWEVDVPGGESEERRDRVGIPKSFSKKSKFVAIVVALGLVNEADAIANGCNVDFDPGLGKRCLGTIVRKPKEGTAEWTDAITAYAPLTRIPSARPRRPQAPVAQDLAEEDIPF